MGGAEEGVERGLEEGGCWCWWGGWAGDLEGFGRRLVGICVCGYLPEPIEKRAFSCSFCTCQFLNECLVTPRRTTRSPNQTTHTSEATTSEVEKYVDRPHKSIRTMDVVQQALVLSSNTKPPCRTVHEWQYADGTAAASPDKMDVGAVLGLRYGSWSRSGVVSCVS